MTHVRPFSKFQSTNIGRCGRSAKIYRMMAPHCERRGLVKRNCGCVPSCDDPSCVCDGEQPSCVCPDALAPIWNGERCVKLEQCDSANNVREKIKQQLEESIVVTSSPSTLNLRFNRISNASRYVIKLLNPSTNEVIKGTTATFADAELQDRNNVAVTVGNLESETEYISNFEVFFETATADSVLRNTPVSFQRMVSTSSMDNSITEVDRNNLTVEKLSNTLCLVFNKMISSVDAYKITLMEVSEADFIVQPQRVPITDQRICFYSLKTATEYEISVASISDNLQSAPVSIRVKTLEEDRDWMEKWYKWRYFSFNQWSKMFDSYARVARKKNFWSRPQNLACPALRDNIPCKSNLVTWKDLNGCTFNLCDQAPEFESRAFDEMATTDSFTSDWEADFRIYKDYLYPQWTALLSAYASLLKSEL
ncbi:unnamed protein product [Oikopleura dioica]|uniref:Uncharacterized protein n=1 Tax=Oikopleura dioica TaxID=34765 RepID=E4XEP6_OIKDI|nr:unnamed protein product [Oikopleura dioica]